MKQLEEYITVGTKRLRCGYTTGTCAAAAARAASELLLLGQVVPAVTIATPAGIDVVVEVEEHETGEGWAQCAVRKDAGRLSGISIGQADHGVAAVLDRRDGTRNPVFDRRFTPLYEVSRHDGDDNIASGFFPGLLNMPGMAGMERIVFRDDSAYFHGC